MVRRSPSGPPSPGAQCRSLANSGQPSVSRSSPPNSVDGLVGEVEERVAVVLVERRADDADVAHQPGLEQVEQPGQQLAPGQVAGRAEEDDGRGLHRHGPSLPPARPEREERRQPRSPTVDPRPGVVLVALGGGLVLGCILGRLDSSVASAVSAASVRRASASSLVGGLGAARGVRLRPMASSGASARPVSENGAVPVSVASICRTLASWELMLSRRWVAAASSRSESARGSARRSPWPR